MSTYTIITIRAIAAYFALLIMARLMGKREVSQMTFFDYIVGITIGSIGAEMAISTNSTWFEILPAFLVFGIFQIASAYLSLKSMKLRKAIDGSPAILIENGKVKERNLLKERLSVSEFMSKLREKNAFKLADVETAVLEPDGKLSVQLKSDKQPATPSDLKLQTQYSGLPRLVIEDGNVLGESLKDIGMTRAWLLSKLGEQGVYDPSEVMLAQVDTFGNLYIDLYDGSQYKPKKSQADQVLLAKLQKLHSDFSTYSLETQNKEAQKLYKECEIEIDSVTSQFKQYIANKKS